MVKIDDGKGGGKQMSVSSTQRGNVSAKTANRIFYSSRDDGLAFAAIYDDVAAAAGEYVAYLKNSSSTKNLFIKDVSFGGVESIKWRIWVVSGTAAAGEEVTPTELNLSKSIPAEALAMAGNTAITGLTNIEQIGTHRTAAMQDGLAMRHSSTILGPNDAIAVEYETGTAGLCEIEVHFWYEEIGSS